jgi:hypothetical protein
MRLDVAVATSLALSFALAGCGSIRQQTTAIGPSVITMTMVQTKGIDPQNCNDWLSPSWQEQEAWWRSLPTSQPPRAGSNAVVGFELLFDTQGNCRKFRQDLYRAGVAYDLSQRQNLKGLVTKAELRFSSFALPSGIRPNNLCQDVTGGGGSFIVLAPSASLPAAPLRMAFLGSANAAAPWPAGSRLFSIPQPWIAGSPANGVSTGATGQGTAAFSVDVTAHVNAALERGAASLSFMLSGSDEAVRTVFPPGAQDCRTTYNFGDLVLTHL